MKNRNKITSLLLVVTVLSGCGSKDTALLDLLPIEAVVNPETKVLVKENTLLHVQLYSDNQIKGFTKNSTFQTTNFFKSFQYQPYSLPNSEIIEFAAESAVGVRNRQTPTTITYSTDFGTSWRSFVPNINGSSPAIGHSVGMITSIKMTDKNTMLMLTGRSDYNFLQNYPSNSTGLYKINVQTGNGDLLSEIQGYYPLTMHFANESIGWMLVNKILQQGNTYSNRNTFITRTTNGGSTWSTPVMVDAEQPLSLTVGGLSNLFLYSGNGGGYLSTDGGATWKKSKSNDRFSNVVIVNNKVQYGVGANGFIKSEDSGENWTDVSLYSYGKLHFINERQGIRYRENTLYITEDGGVTWKVLLYPFPYVIS